MLQGIYETFRDNDHYPLFWESQDVCCLPHFHSGLEVAYVKRGRVDAIINGRPVSAGSGELLISSCYAVHSYLKDCSSECILLIVPQGFIPLYAPIFAKKVFAYPISRDTSPDGEVYHCLKMLLAFRECSEQNENLVRSYIYVIIGLLIRSVGLTDTPEKGGPSEEVLAYLQDNYRCPVSLEALSHRFGYSKYRFSRIFNQSVGCTLTQYVDSLRSRHAANLLRESDSPMLEIAMSSGFDSVRTFYRSFKLCFGMTPTQYRKSHQ